jgi:uncharacterized protein YdeI (YjbR/CyaY-like superfamily)
VSQAATQPEPVLFATAADFRAWLEENHATAGELWVGYYKKASGKSSMTYAEAVEEALCYGWIDGITRSFGADVYANRFTPRRPKSNWSAINIAKVAELQKQGRMRPAGLRAFEQRDPRRDAVYSYERRAELPTEIEARLRADKAAWAYWTAETPSYRRGVIQWLLDAKREETRERRLADLIDDSAAGRRIKPYRYFESQRAGS